LGGKRERIYQKGLRHDLFTFTGNLILDPDCYSWC
jgi:hypothetical protein